MFSRRVAAVWLTIQAVAFGQGYSFTKLAFTGAGSSYTELTPLSISPNGMVLIRALAGERRELLLSRAGVLTKLIDDSGEIFEITSGTVNSSGDVIIGAILDNRSVGLFRVADGKLTQVYRTSDPVESTVFATWPRLSDTGWLTFTTQPRPVGDVGGASRVYVNFGGNTLAIADQATTLGGSSATHSDVNNSGQVAFVSGSGTASGVFVWDPATNRTTRVTGDGAVRPTFAEFAAVFTPPNINDSGAIVYRYQDAASVIGLRVYQPGAPTQLTIATQSNSPAQSPFYEVNFPMINNQGTVAFGALGNPGTAPIALYTVKGGVRSTVIAAGDSLFGSVVNGIFIPPLKYLDNAGRVAFLYWLVNGERGVAMATPALTLPAIAANAVLNAASFATAGQPGHAIAPGTLVSIFGSDLSSGIVSAPSGSTPKQLGETSVTFDGVAAALLAATPNLIIAQVPFTVSGSTASVRVRTAAGEGPATIVPVAPTSPAIYTALQQGSGQGIAVVANTAIITAPAGFVPGARPARGGEVLTIYANGLGAVNPPIAAGQNSCDPDGVCLPDFSNLVLRSVVNPVTIEVGGVTVPPSDIFFAGLAPLYVGSYQINFRLPSTTPKGNAVPIVLRQGGVASRNDVTIAIE